MTSFHRRPRRQPVPPEVARELAIITDHVLAVGRPEADVIPLPEPRPAVLHVASGQ